MLYQMTKAIQTKALNKKVPQRKLTPPNFPGAIEFFRSDANVVAPLHCNSLIAKSPTFPPTVVKSECYGFVYGSFCADPTRNDALTQQLWKAQFLNNLDCKLWSTDSAIVLTLDKPNVFVISGNVVKYWAFIRALENLIVKRVAGQNTQLYFLVLYTSVKVQSWWTAASQ